MVLQQSMYQYLQLSIQIDPHMSMERGSDKRIHFAIARFGLCFVLYFVDISASPDSAAFSKWRLKHWTAIALTIPILYSPEQ